MNPQEINSFNVSLKHQPWYQQWFLQNGLNMNAPTHLTDQQRQSLQQAATQNGMPLPHGLIIDTTGNAGTHHGFAGQPGWLKALEIGGAGAAGIAFGGPALMGLLGHTASAGGAAALGSSGISGAAAGTGAAAAAAPAVAGAGAAAAIPTLTSISGAPITAVNAVPSLTGAFTPAAASSNMAMGLPSLAGHVATGAGAPGGGVGSTISNLLGHKGTQDLTDAASTLGSYAGAQANNRTEMANLGQNYDQARLQAQQDQRANESDAMHKLASSGYVLGGGSHYTPPPPLSLGGRSYSIPDLGLGPTPISEAERQGATTLQDQMLKRLQPGGSVQPTDPSKYAHQGFGEKAANTGSLVLGGLGAFRSIFGK